MGLFILAVLLGLVGVALLVLAGPLGRAWGNDGGVEENARMFARIVGVILALVGISMGLFAMSYSVDTGEAVLVKKGGGGVASVVTDTGYHLKAPWSKTSTWNTRKQRIELCGNDADGPPVQTGFDGGGAGGSVCVSLVYSIPGDNLESLYNEHRDQGKLEENRLLLALKDTTATESAKYDAFTVRERRVDLQDDIFTSLEEELSDEVRVDRIELGDINLPENTEAALNAIVDRQSQTESAQADLETARVKAAEDREIAKGEADAAQIARCGGTEKTVEQTINGEKQNVTVIVPNSSTNCQNALTPEVLANKYIEALRAIGTSDHGPATIVVPESINGLLQFPGTATG